MIGGRVGHAFASREDSRCERFAGHSQDEGREELILVTARIKAHIAQRRELTQALLQWAAAAKRERGTLATDVYEDVAEGNIFCVVSQWTSLRALQAHLRGPAFGSLLGAIDLLADRSTVSVTEAADHAEASMSLRRLRVAGRHVPQSGLP
jgi:quinol monooxygenase YgiN